MLQMREAFPWNQAPRYLGRDRDTIYGQDFFATTKGMGMEEVRSAQLAVAESLRGTADRFRSARKFGPCDRLESAILASNSTKLLCLLPALPNSSSPSQGRPGVENS
jgi:hypothetical protein